MQQQLEVTSWQARPSSAAWIATTGSPLVVERRTPSVVEQRILLPNPTDLSGDNLIHLRTVNTYGGTRLFSLDRALDFIDGLPVPFTEETLQVMRSREDAAGTLIWGEWTDGAGLNCALALRRVDLGVNIGLRSGTAFDMVMRNCVSGDIEAALAPVGPQAFVRSSPEIGVSGTDRPYTLSPLAAPGI